MIVNTTYDAVGQTLQELIATSPNAEIVVPTLDLYHQLRGMLTLENSTITVTCLPPPSKLTKLAGGGSPYYVTDKNHVLDWSGMYVKDDTVADAIDYFFKHITQE